MRWIIEVDGVRESETYGTHQEALLARRNLIARGLVMRESFLQIIGESE